MSTASVTPRSPSSPPGQTNNNNSNKPGPSYLKGYPYLFVRETDQVQWIG